ncbi:MAG TPA: AAA family ATPase [Nitrospira sp.]|nr:AAA family ATPase [Nitrospira sp.]MCW5795325.1 AAA family ATPase [Nitrospira sp.]HMU29640.1 AAA family ATPase [Nitrospira sp.]HMV55932.1 AAA family ATPase [Nitrospira sp.]HMW85633.1 AAA family ATPase [Nitrospira sp.]
MSDHRNADQPGHGGQPSPSRDASTPADPIELIDECLAAFPDGDPRQKLLYKLRHVVTAQSVAQDRRDTELKKLNEVVAKLTAPANRVGLLVEVPAEGVARIVVGGAEYYANIDPRLAAEELKIGAQILVNEAYTVIKALEYDRNGPVLKVAEILPDGRIRFEQDMGRQALILQRSSDLLGVDLKAGDEVRIEPTHRIAIEKFENRQARTHLLDEVPNVTWEQIGGQHQAIDAIRKAIEYPLLHADTFTKYQFTQPKGFLLYGPPGCGKTMIGQAAAASLSQLVRESHGQAASDGHTKNPPVTSGAFLHIKGPEILNMWLGESERIVRDLFAKARARRKEGALPFIFIDEAESVLGTRRSMRSFNINNTLVPMFCAEMDGIESLQDVVIILASNRPDLIDPAVLRPGRIDRKIKVARPTREAAVEILSVYLTPALPLEPALLEQHDHSHDAARRAVIEQVVDSLFSRTDQNRVLSIRLRNGQNKVLYRGDLVSGAILSAIVQRAKEKAIERAVAQTGAAAGDGIRAQDLLDAVQEEYREGEMLPPDDAAEEWLKLLDHHPEQVVGVSSFRRGRPTEERLVNQII